MAVLVLVVEKPVRIEDEHENDDEDESPILSNSAYAAILVRRRH